VKYKKTIVIAEEWLIDGELPSGKTWEDLYAHILSEGSKINEKDAMFVFRNTRRRGIIR